VAGAHIPMLWLTMNSITSFVKSSDGSTSRKFLYVVNYIALTGVFAIRTRTSQYNGRHRHQTVHFSRLWCCTARCKHSLRIIGSRVPPTKIPASSARCDGGRTSVSDASGGNFYHSIYIFQYEHNHDPDCFQESNTSRFISRSCH